jgi:glycosyltransferase involved in cell wall biosynthesis
MIPTIHILYKFTAGPWGGGNQFLKALQGYFRDNEIYSEDPKNADMILFNSHHSLKEVYNIKKKYPEKILIHRIDGPIFYVRGKDELIDEIIFQANRIFADGTIFQSNWSRQKNYELGLSRNLNERVIINAPDPKIFNREGKKPFAKKKIRLIATSWSTNIRKGFDIYKFLDNNLDFDRYEMTFVGNSRIKFKNIEWIKPVPNQEVARLLKEHDIYVIASRSDPCSNALIEGLHCGLPAVAKNDGGHPDIICKAGELFEDTTDVLTAIEMVSNDLLRYQEQIKLSTLNEVGKEYYNFAQSIYNEYLKGNYCSKDVNFYNVGHLDFRLKRWIKWQKSSTKFNPYYQILNLLQKAWDRSILRKSDVKNKQ